MKKIKAYLKDRYLRLRYPDAYEGRHGAGVVPYPQKSSNETDRREFFRNLVAAPVIAAAATEVVKAEPVKEVAKVAPQLPPLPGEWMRFTGGMYSTCSTSFTMTNGLMPYGVFVHIPKDREEGCADTWALTVGETEDADLRGNVREP